MGLKRLWRPLGIHANTKFCGEIGRLKEITGDT